MNASSGDIPPPSQDVAIVERERLRRVYDAYDGDPRYRRMWGDSPANRFMLNRKWDLIARVVREADLGSHDTRVLDLGSGDRGDSARFGDLGVPGSGIVAFDLIPLYALRMMDANPMIKAVTGDAATLPFRDGSFGIVYQSTMLSSLLEMDLRRRVLKEIARVLVAGGMFLSYDVRYRNPWNPNTRPLKTSDLKEAFMGWPLTIQSVTGIPQLLRLLAPLSIGVCRLIEGIPALRTHLLAVARKP